MQNEKNGYPATGVAPARIEVHVASAATPEPAARPVTPSLFTDAALAAAHMDAAMRQEWEANAPEDDEGEKLPYPDDWQAAHDAMAAGNDAKDPADELWGEHALTSHEVEVSLDVAVPRATYDLMSRAFAGLLAARGNYDDLQPELVCAIVDAVEASSKIAAGPGAEPVRKQAVDLSVNLGEWRTLEELVRLGLREAEARAASTANDGGVAKRRYRQASELATRLSGDAHRAIEAMAPEAIVAVWEAPDGWYFDDAENHGGFDAASPQGPYRTRYDAKAWAHAAFPFKILIADGRPSHYGEGSP